MVWVRRQVGRDAAGHSFAALAVRHRLGNCSGVEPNQIIHSTTFESSAPSNLESSKSEQEQDVPKWKCW